MPTIFTLNGKLGYTYSQWNNIYSTWDGKKTLTAKAGKLAKQLRKLGAKRLGSVTGENLSFSREFISGSILLDREEKRKKK